MANATHSTTRRNFLRGSAAAVAVVGSATAALALTSGELNRLIAAHKAAEVEEDRRVDVFGEFENEHGVGGRKTQSRALCEELREWCGEGHGAASDALWELITYHPRTVAEAALRSDYLLSKESILMGLDDEWVSALAWSFSTEAMSEAA